VYDVSGAASDRNVVVLNDIHIDIMDYIVPASCNDTEFRQMWALSPAAIIHISLSAWETLLQYMLHTSIYLLEKQHVATFHEIADDRNCYRIAQPSFPMLYPASTMYSNLNCL
jgi:vesicle coat complex subunit